MRIFWLANDTAAKSAEAALWQAAGIAAIRQADPVAAAQTVRGGGFDVVLVDLDTTGLDATGLDGAGLDACDWVRRLRAADVSAPVIMLSEDCRPELKVRAFAVGADDFITRPFDAEEVVARLHAVMRRGKGACRPSLRVGRMELRLDSQELLVDGRSIPVTEKELAVMELLMLRRGLTLTKEALLAHLYRGMDEPNAKIIDVFICKLRRKLSQAGLGDAIRTVWGHGYTVPDAAIPPAKDIPAAQPGVLLAAARRGTSARLAG